MESEKVKEIKKALECCSVSCTDCPYDKGETTNPICINNLTKNALTLINELESENERYKQSCGAIGQNSLTIINQLKDRIAELEKENEAKTDTITDLLNKQEFYEKEKLKQFSTLLKVKTVLTPSGWCVNIEDIDEALKEFFR